MDKQTTPKQTTKKPFYKTFVGSIVCMIAVTLALYFIAISSLGIITDHGNEKIVPELIGKSKDDALKLLESEGFDVVVDSTYDPSKPALVVLDQQPKLGRHVKPGRNIFITINKALPPESPMPNLINLSLRSASLVLKSSKLVLGDTVIRPDFSKGAVLEQLYNGEKIATGTMVPQGSKIDVVIGGGISSGFINVPSVYNISLEMAKTALTEAGVYYDIVYEGTITDTANAYVIEQNPSAKDEDGAPNKMAQGESIRLTVSQEPKAANP